MLQRQYVIMYQKLYRGNVMTDLNLVKRGEIYRYMGFRDEIPDANIREMTEEVISELAKVSNPKFCTADAEFNIKGNSINFGGFSLESLDLANHLKGCERGVFIGVTLGAEADLLIYKFSALSPSKAVAAQAAASAMVEMAADEVCEEISKTLENLYLTPRYSPGYGDLDISCQKEFLKILSAEKRIGLCLTASGMLTPVKSITAVAGFTKEKLNCKEHKCSTCMNKTCAYRESTI